MLWVVLVLILIAVVWVWRVGTRAAPNRIEDGAGVSNALRYLIQRGVDGGSVRFQVNEDASRAVVFTKYIIAHGNVGLRARCSRGGESEARFRALRNDMVERGIRDFTLTSDGETLEMDIGRDLGLGVVLVGLVFQQLFETELRTHCVAFFDGVVIRDESTLTGVDDAPSS